MKTLLKLLFLISLTFLSIFLIFDHGKRSHLEIEIKNKGFNYALVEINTEELKEGDDRARLLYSDLENDSIRETSWIPIKEGESTLFAIEGLAPETIYTVEAVLKHDQYSSNKKKFTTDFKASETSLENANVEKTPETSLENVNVEKKPQINLENVNVKPRKFYIDGKVDFSGKDVDIWFEWGRFKDFMEKEDLFLNEQLFSIEVDGLKPGTKYYYRVFASWDGEQVSTEIRSIETPNILSPEAREFIESTNGSFEAHIEEIGSDNLRARTQEGVFTFYYDDRLEIFINPVSERSNYAQDYFENYEGFACPYLSDEDLAQFRLREAELSQASPGDYANFQFFNYKAGDYLLNRIIIEK